MIIIPILQMRDLGHREEVAKLHSKWQSSLLLSAALVAPREHYSYPAAPAERREHWSCAQNIWLCIPLPTYSVTHASHHLGLPVFKMGVQLLGCYGDETRSRNPTLVLEFPISSHSPFRCPMQVDSQRLQQVRGHVTFYGAAALSGKGPGSSLQVLHPAWSHSLK